jgi:hypothetical protein
MGQHKTNSNKKKMLRALKKSRGLITKACAASKISRSAYYEWYNEDIDFKNQVDELMDNQVEDVEDKLLGLIDNDNTAAVIFYLKNKSPNFKPSMKIEAEVTGELKINAIFNSDLIKEDED